MQTETQTNLISKINSQSAKEREAQRREKQRQESEPKNVQRQRLMAAIAEAENAGRDQPKKRRSKLSKSPREGLQARVVVPSEGPDDATKRRNISISVVNIWKPPATGAMAQVRLTSSWSARCVIAGRYSTRGCRRTTIRRTTEQV